MPNGQDRHADTRKSRKGRTIRMGKTLGDAPVEGRIEDFARDWLPLLTGLSLDSWERLGGWVVALAEAEGLQPTTNVIPEVEEEILRFLTKEGVLRDPDDEHWQPVPVTLRPFSPAERRELKAQYYFLLCELVEAHPQLREQYLPPGEEQRWDEWFRYYHQCNGATEGQQWASARSAVADDQTGS